MAKRKRQTIQWPKEKDRRQYNDQKKKAEDNTMTQKKDRRQKTIQWQKEKDRRQYNDQKKKDKQWSTKHNTNKQKIEQHEPTKMIVICKDSNYDDQT